MKNFFERSEADQAVIKKAYEFEQWAVINDSCARNPYQKKVEDMGIWEDLVEAVEMWEIALKEKEKEFENLLKEG